MGATILRENAIQLLGDCVFTHTPHLQLKCLEHAQFCEQNSKMSTYTHLYYVSGTATVIHGLCNWIAGVMQMKIKPNPRICFMW